MTAATSYDGAAMSVFRLIDTRDEGAVVIVHLVDGTALYFSDGPVFKLGGPPPWKRDPKRIVALVAALPEQGGPPVLFCEQRIGSRVTDFDAYGRHFVSERERERVVLQRVDPLQYWRGSYGSEGPDAPVSRHGDRSPLLRAAQ